MEEVLGQEVIEQEHIPPAEDPALAFDQGDSDQTVILTDPDDLAAKLEEANMELEKIRQRAESQDLMIRRQGSELGELRKKVYTPLTDQDRNAIASRISSGDYSAIDEIEARGREVQKHETEYAQSEADIAKAEISRNIPNFESYIDDIADLAGRVGYSADNVKAFKEDPYGSSSPETVINLAKEVIRQKGARTANLDGSTNTAADVVNRLASASRSTVVRSSTGGASRNTTSASSIDLSSLSDEQLDTLMRDEGLIK